MSKIELIDLEKYFEKWVNNKTNIVFCFCLQRIPNISSCPVKSPQPLKEFVGRCQTMPSRVKKSFCGCLQVSFRFKNSIYFLILHLD